MSKNAREPKDLIERHNRRADIHTEGVRSLFLLNGGGAIALLAFLPQIWTIAPELIESLAWGLIWMAIGLVLAAPVNHIRYETSRDHDDWSQKKRYQRGQVFGIAHRFLFIASLLMFIVAVTVVACGILVNLPDT